MDLAYKYRDSNKRPGVLERNAAKEAERVAMIRQDSDAWKARQQQLADAKTAREFTLNQQKQKDRGLANIQSLKNKGQLANTGLQNAGKLSEIGMTESGLNSRKALDLGEQRNKNKLNFLADIGKTSTGVTGEKSLNSGVFNSLKNQSGLFGNQDPLTASGSPFSFADPVEPLTTQKESKINSGGTVNGIPITEFMNAVKNSPADNSGGRGENMNVVNLLNQGLPAQINPSNTTRNESLQPDVAPIVERPQTLPAARRLRPSPSTGQLQSLQKQSALDVQRNSAPTISNNFQALRKNLAQYDSTPTPIQRNMNVDLMPSTERYDKKGFRAAYPDLRKKYPNKTAQELLYLFQDN